MGHINSSKRARAASPAASSATALPQAPGLPDGWMEAASHQSGWRLFGRVSRSGGRQRPSLAPSGSEWGRGVLQTGQGPLEAVSEARRAAV